MKTIAHAVWKDWAHVGLAYRVRERHSDNPSADSDKDGFMWFDSYKKPVDRPCETIRFHGGPRAGQVDTKSPGAE